MQLPNELAPLFHNYSFASIDDQKHAALVIKTVLAEGRWEQILWLFRHYGYSRIELVFRADYYGLQELPEPTRRLWRILFMPDEPVTNPKKDPLSRWRSRRVPISLGADRSTPAAPAKVEK